MIVVALTLWLVYVLHSFAASLTLSGSGRDTATAFASYCGPVIYIFASMDKQEITFLILIDLSAVFDTVKHRPLINILDNDFATAGVVRKWFESCLAERK